MALNEFTGDPKALDEAKTAANWIIANYNDDPHLAGEVIHQYSDKADCPPFGLCDMNSADDRTPRELARQLGITVGKAWGKRNPLPPIVHRKIKAVA